MNDLALNDMNIGDRHFVSAESEVSKQNHVTDKDEIRPTTANRKTRYKADYCKPGNGMEARNG